MAFSAFTFVNGGAMRLVADVGLQWDQSAHYAVLIKNAHTPAGTNTLYSNISANVCTSSNYAHQNIASKSLTESNGVITANCANIDFSNGSADTMIARYMYLLEGAAGSPQASDRVIGYVDLSVGGSSDVGVDAPILTTAGIISSTIIEV